MMSIRKGYVCYAIFVATKNVLVDVTAAGRKGGKARAAGMTKEERSEAARAAVTARWAKAKKATKKAAPKV
jgi:topoisomerase IA-like protein